ncbi:unnamed protein product [Debaryomyces fabryi]|nr:unnamed protein product [Debaryomyces fabryi]
MKMVIMPNPKGIPAAVGAIQWIEPVLPVQPNQKRDIGRQNAPTLAGSSLVSGAERINFPFSSRFPRVPSWFLGL